ncbi:single-pass membrane and coiled-coil domain-containing protein 3-like [Emydura macquarii macquarii]|uniref:single-pass membrane and coiled-coil domain-containing protein 3-like n=1 Tax=Emydura macquarii macquarii TaxID=1129001 RepID=UPI00352A1B99
MSWSDLLYPGNPDRRAKVVRLHQELIDCIELNFDAANTLIDVLNTHWTCKLSPVKMNKQGTIKENTDVFLAAMKSIQGVLQDIDKALASKLEPALYRKLHNVQETDATKMKILAEVTIGVVTAGIFFTLIYSNVTISACGQITALMAEVGISLFGGIVASALVGVGLNLILSAIIGATERSQLEAEIQKLEALVNEFKPASKEYYKTIIEVKIICQQRGK